MLIQGEYNRTAEIGFRGFEEPLEAGYIDDECWLMVELDIHSDKQKYHRVDAALMVGEVKKLVQWLRNAAQGLPVNRTLNFLEPCLAFTLVRDDGPVKMIRITFAAELKPVWYDSPAYAQLCLLTNRQLEELAAEFERELGKLAVGRKE